MVTSTAPIDALVGAYTAWADERRSSGRATTLSHTVQKLEEIAKDVSCATPTVVWSYWDGFAQQEAWYEDGIWRFRARGPEGYDSDEGFATTQHLAMDGARDEAHALRKRVEGDLYAVGCEITYLMRLGNEWNDPDEAAEWRASIKACREKEQLLFESLHP